MFAKPISNITVCAAHVASAANIPSQFIQRRVQKSRYKKNIEVPNIIHWCGARQLALFLTLEHHKNMLAAGKKRGGDKILRIK